MLQFRKPNIVIVGSGRSGTSTIARICHTELNICMGHFLKSSDPMNPTGYYEDLVSHGLVRAMTDGSYSAEIYLTLMNHFHSGCLTWGAKDPWFLYCPLHTLKQLTPKLCIIATRDVESTVNSWVKVWKQSKPQGAEPTQEVIDHYTNLTVSREEQANALKQIWPNVLTIDFTERVEEEAIAKQIRNGLTFSNIKW